jgi:hypothetical protein
MFWSAECSLLIKNIKIKFPAVNLLKFSSSNPGSGSAIRKNAGSGSALNQCGPATLKSASKFWELFGGSYEQFLETLKPNASYCFLEFNFHAYPGPNSSSYQKRSKSVVPVKAMQIICCWRTTDRSRISGSGTDLLLGGSWVLTKIIFNFRQIADSVPSSISPLGFFEEGTKTI